MKRTGKRIISMLLCVLLASALSTTALAAEDGKVLKLAFTDSPTLVIGDMTIYQSWRKAPAFRHGDISHTLLPRKEILRGLH